jgi:threonine aldolase
MRSFASDNNSGVHPEVMDAIAVVNAGHVISYGDDPYTEAATQKIKSCFGDDADPFFVFAGTAANVLSLKQVTDSYNSIICAESAHIHNDECGAPEHFTGCKLLTSPSSNGKLTLEGFNYHLHGFGFEHHAQPKVVSITQATELGTVYTLDEIQEIADIAHQHNMLLHVDGARLCNAAVRLGTSLREMTTDAGVDILSFGGTKNGMMFGECIIFLKKDLSTNFKYVRKQGMQLASKMRYIAAQYNAYLDNNLWFRNAKQANDMAQLLAEQVSSIPQVQLTQKVESNGVFAIIPKKVIPKLQEKYFFYVWNEAASEVRWMTSFDTTQDDIMQFASNIKAALL